MIYSIELIPQYEIMGQWWVSTVSSMWLKDKHSHITLKYILHPCGIYPSLSRQFKDVSVWHVCLHSNRMETNEWILICGSTDTVKEMHYLESQITLWADSEGPISELNVYVVLKRLHISNIRCDQTSANLKLLCCVTSHKGFPLRREIDKCNTHKVVRVLTLAGSVRNTHTDIDHTAMKNTHSYTCSSSQTCSYTPLIRLWLRGLGEAIISQLP